MRKTHWFIALLLAATLVFGFAGCSSDSDDDDDDSGSSSSVTLPASVGTNPFSGKTWGASSSYYSSSIAFSSNTVTISYTYSADTDTFTYSYSYDADKGLLYMAVKGGSTTIGSNTYTFSSISDYKSFVSSVLGESGAELDKDVAGVTQMFNTMTVYKYEISSDSSLTMYSYFNGLPTAVDFDYDKDNLKIESENGGFVMQYYGDSSEYYIYPTFSNGTFSGTMYKRVYDSNDEKVYSTLGTASGTYTTSGTGTSGCTITIKFTTLPDGVTGFAANTAYTLSQNDNNGRTLPLKQ